MGLLMIPTTMATVKSMKTTSMEKTTMLTA
jgi:hypothetical protein